MSDIQFGRTKQLTVSELIDLLAKFPPDMLVQVEGCDCIGVAVGVDLMDHISPNEILITRE